jgi:(p)ppGpp synthase/HD superfamily hydrolase
MNAVESFPEALAYAASAHRQQVRKGSGVPYISHLLGVTAIVLDAGGTESEAIAAVLHDVVEDQPLPGGGGRARLADVRSRFGEGVAAMVEALSDWVSESEFDRKEDSGYLARKTAYHEHLRAQTDKSVLLVSAADKLHNARSMEADFDWAGARLWERFNGTPEQIFWNYDRLIAIYRGSAVEDARRVTIVEPLAETVERLKAKSGRGTPLAAS